MLNKAFFISVIDLLWVCFASVPHSVMVQRCHRIFEDCPVYCLKLATVEKTLMKEELWWQCHGEIIYIFILDLSQLLSLVTTNTGCLRRVTVTAWE